MSMTKRFYEDVAEIAYRDGVVEATQYVIKKYNSTFIEALARVSESMAYYDEG